jgi:hypothetical protein
MNQHPDSATPEAVTDNRLVTLYDLHRLIGRAMAMLLGSRDMGVLTREVTSNTLGVPTGSIVPYQDGANICIEVDEGPRTVWMLRRWVEHEDENVSSVWSSKEQATAFLARKVQEYWEDVSWREDRPEEPPADDQEAIDLYYGPEAEWDERGRGYKIVAREVDDEFEVA